MAGLVVLAGSPLVAAPAGAPRVVIAQPQGEVGLVRQVRVRFDRPVVTLGDPLAADPFELRCEGPAPAGSGRWADDREWVYDFTDALPPATRCTATLRAAWAPLAAGGAASAAVSPSAPAVAGTTRFAFATGGPAVVRVLPWPGSPIDEDALFMLQFNGEPQARSVRERTACIVQGLGDQVPTRLVEGAARDELLASQRVPRRLAARTVVLGCDRPLPPAADVRLVVLPGVLAAGSPATPSRAEQTFAWTVRPPFTAEFSCERERAGAPCWPVRPLTVGFSATAARADLQQVRLRRVDAGSAEAAIAPIVEGEPRDAEARFLRFPVPLAENATYTIELPPGLRDSTGRALANAGSFPLRVATGSAPPIAKFAAAPFGVIELEPAPRGEAPRGVLPITLRHVQPDFPAAGGPSPGAAAPPATPGSGSIRVRRFDAAADILEWIGRLERFHETTITAREAGRPAAEWQESVAVTDEQGRTRQVRRERYVGTREVSLLQGDAAAATLPLPAPAARDAAGASGARPFEVVGLPLAAPGYHVVEIASPRLGAALLEPAAPMFVRTGVLVTNLGVHFKHGRESSAAWVTSLDRGRPVAGADVTVHDCRGATLWSGRTDAQGVARIAQRLDPLPALTPGGAPAAAARPARRCPAEESLFVMARHTATPRGAAAPVNDVAFVMGHWQRGIESWRFDLPQRRESEPDRVAHTVFDRTLLRAGETVSMKHFLRIETAHGLALPDASALPQQAVLVHAGTGQETALPIAWSGARSATSAWSIPAGARLGRYEVWLERREAAPATASTAAASGVAAGERRRTFAGDFRVEAFRVPLIDARLVPPATIAAGVRELAFGVQMSYLAGGGVQQSSATVSALVSPRAVSFPGFEGWRFDPPRAVRAGVAAPPEDDEPAAREAGRLVADKQPVATDRQGAGQVVLRELPAVDRPSELLAELSFTDPNGEVQTVARRVALWPSAVVLGVRTASWARERDRAAVQVVALDTAGATLRGQAVQVRGRLVQVSSTRKRMVGGFFAYENRTDVQDLGVLCRGTTDARGQFRCEADLAAAGEIELIAEASDAAGRAAQAATSVWVSRQGDLWFGQDNDDRIDLLPEKRRYAPGETARLQVRAPYRESTALVSIEREGVIDTRVVTLRGDDPTVELAIDPAWTPNVVVSVLAVRGRVREVPWTSFFDWGWRTPVDWWRAWRQEGPQYQAPTALVDLAKPSFKLGAAMIEVGGTRHDLQVSVVPDAPRYAIRQTAQVRVRVTRDGRPLAAPAGAAAPVVEVAFAAVDEGLLALAENASWDLKAGLLRERPWGVETSTAHGEIVGRRHYGRKTVAAGGGGGRGATRELFDTLLTWRARVTLDAQGEAVVPVPLNDSLTSFRLVAVADALIADGPGEPLQAFGTGSATIVVSQDLQVLAGLPLLLREGDRFDALLTVRNTTARAMTLDVALRGLPVGAAGSTAPEVIAPPPQAVTVAAGGAAELRFAVAVPSDVTAIDWEARADEPAAAGSGGGAPRAADRVRRRVAVAPAVPVRVQQATLAPLAAGTPLEWPLAAPAGALATAGIPRGGVQVSLRPRLADGLPGVIRWFEAYPYACLEQRASRALALDDRPGWAALVATLPAHLDGDGLAAYFPLDAGGSVGPGGGSDRLTAYLVSAAHEAGAALPPELLEPLLGGLLAFVEGRLERRPWAPDAARALDRDVRRLAALEALSRHGRALPRHLTTLRPDPATWPTAALLDWLAVLRRLPGSPDVTRRIDEARQALRGRIGYAGTTLRFSRESDDFWWWLMDSPDANAARLILAAVDDPAWADELPRLVIGHLGRQREGAWLTTTANLWSTLALRRFSQRFEATPVQGRSVAAVGGREQVLDWSAAAGGGTLEWPWPPAAPGGAPGVLAVRHEGAGRPWVSVQAQAAVPLASPRRAGYAVRRSVAAVDRRDPAAWSRGDVMRVRLEVEAGADMTWVVVDDPVPAGATVLGSGLGRDSVLATRGENAAVANALAPSHIERMAGAWRAYFEFLPRGRHVVEYTVRLNQPGRFGLPPTRVEAMYAPETFGEVPNAALEVRP